MLLERIRNNNNKKNRKKKKNYLINYHTDFGILCIKLKIDPFSGDHFLFWCQKANIDFD